MFFSILLAVALSRADLIERMNAQSVIKNDGLVEVSGMCSPDVRREFQLPVAASASKICDVLYSELKINRRKFKAAPIHISFGENSAADTNVSVRIFFRADGSICTRLRLSSPGFADMELFRREVSRAFLAAMGNRRVSDGELKEALMRADPIKRHDEEYAALKLWATDGVYRNGWDDEEYLKRLRRVKEPGKARYEDVLHFASRLHLYPAHYGEPFCGKYSSCTFKDAIKYAKIDINVRKAALAKSTEVVVFGGGRGERLSEAARVYSQFLIALASGKVKEETLFALLSYADEKLNEVMK